MSEMIRADERITADFHALAEELKDIDAEFDIESNRRVIYRNWSYGMAIAQFVATKDASVRWVADNLPTLGVRRSARHLRNCYTVVHRATERGLDCDALYTHWQNWTTAEKTLAPPPAGQGLPTACASEGYNSQDTAPRAEKNLTESEENLPVDDPDHEPDPWPVLRREAVTLGWTAQQRVIDYLQQQIDRTWTRSNTIKVVRLLELDHD